MKNYIDILFRLVYDAGVMVKKAIISAMLLAGVAAGELVITENVCIDFGEKLLVEDNWESTMILMPRKSIILIPDGIFRPAMRKTSIAIPPQ